MASAYVPYSDVYNDPDYSRGPRPDRSRVQSVPYEDIDAVRQRQFEEYYRPRAQRDELSQSNLTAHQSAAARKFLRERSADDAYRRSRRRDDDYSSRSSSRSDDRDDQNRRRRNSRRDDNTALTRRTQSEKRNQSKQSNTYDGDVRGMAQRNLDFSPDGALVAALGAGVGAIAARRFGGNHYDPKAGSQSWKTVGGALAGGLAANAAEAYWQKHRQDKKAKAGQYED